MFNTAMGDGGGVASVGMAVVVFGAGAWIQQNTASNRGGGVFVGGLVAEFGMATSTTLKLIACQSFQGFIDSVCSI